MLDFVFVRERERTEVFVVQYLLDYTFAKTKIHP